MNAILTLFISLIFLVILIFIECFLIMIIWNNVIIKKFPSSNIKKLSFWDAMAIAVFVGLLCGGGTIINYGNINKD